MTDASTGSSRSVKEAGGVPSTCSGANSTLRGAESNPVRVVLWRPIAILTGLIVSASVGYFLASWLRFEGFFAENWDLGLDMQMLWTNTHGYLLWEAGDAASIHANSFLFIHTTYIALPVSYLYGLLPWASTLFALQAVAIASGTIPLYLIGQQARVPEWLLYPGLVVYLASLPILAGFLFDFHWEALIPAEFLWTFYLWDRGRYWWAAVSAIAGCLTLEIFPFLIIGIVAYFAVPFIHAPPAGSFRQKLGRVGLALRGPALPLIALTALAAAGYIGPRLVEDYLLPVWVGGAPHASTSPTYSLLGIRLWGVTASTILPRLLYWFLLFASFGFLPLLVRQRLLILSIPWAAYSIIMTRFSDYTHFGFQYSLIAVAPIAIGFIQGLACLPNGSDQSRRSPLWSSAWILVVLPFLAASLTDSTSLIVAESAGLLVGAGLTVAVLVTCLVLLTVGYRGSRVGGRLLRLSIVRRRGHGIAKIAIVGSIAVLISSNVAMSPFNPSNSFGPGTAGYSFGYSPSPSFQYMAGLVGLIPTGAPVLASDNLFPFVANNPHAYSLLWYPAVSPYLPFNSTHLPQYVLLSTTQWFVPSFLESALFTPGIYGTVRVVYSSIFWPGSIFLFQLGYSGPLTIIEATPFPATTVLCGNGLALGASGVVVPFAGSRCGAAIESEPASNLSGNGRVIWYGPYSVLLPGNYTVTLSLEGKLSAAGPSNALILVTNANAAGTGYWYDAAIHANQVSMTHWTNFTYHFHVTSVLFKTEWRGYLEGATVNGTFVPGVDILNYIEVDYVPSDGLGQ